MSRTLSLAERSAILDREIATYSSRGYRVVSRTDTSAQLARQKPFSCFWAFVWFLLLGFGLLIYLFYYISKRDDLIWLEVDDGGRVRRR